MAQSRPAPGVSNVPDPGGAIWPTNTPMAQPAPARYGPASSPATSGQGVMRSGTSLPLNTPLCQPVSQLAGSSPAPAIQAVGSGPGGASGLPTRSQPATTSGALGGGMNTRGGIASVPDPGGPRFAIGSVQTIGYPGDTAVPAGGDPSALGTSYSSGDADAPTWSQFNPNFNPNPGALSGGTAQIPGLYPGETPANQVSPQANPNPGGL